MLGFFSVHNQFYIHSSCDLITVAGVLKIHITPEVGTLSLYLQK